MKRIFTLLLAAMITLSGNLMEVKAAPAWPDAVGIQAEGGIVMDADSGTVLYGQNIHAQYFPASITKVMTALLVIENTNLDDIVTFSHNAVFNVEAGSSNAGLDVGDQLSVRDCLYAMLLRSANEVANALAEHVAGSIEAFADLMNQKAKELGCKNTNFMNPSGLNDPQQLTTAYDMALITGAAYQNDTLVEIASATSYKLPVTIRNPEGLSLSPGHKMMNPKSSRYYPGILFGKTGYTRLAGNTLVTCAERDGLRLVAVVLNGQQTHYDDTKALLDFGFENFKSVRISENENRYQRFNEEIAEAGVSSDQSQLAWDNSGTITLPKDAQFSDALAAVTYEISPADGLDTVAKIQYTYGERKIGAAYLKPGAIGPSVTVANATVLADETENSLEERKSATADDAQDRLDEIKRGSSAGGVILIILVLGAMGGIGIAYKVHYDRKEEEERKLRRKQRMDRLRDGGYSKQEFEELLSKRKHSHKSDGTDKEE